MFGCYGGEESDYVSLCFAVASFCFEKVFVY